VSYHVAKVHLIVGSRIGPCVKGVVQCVFGENAAVKVDMVHYQITLYVVALMANCVT
jgi:hypothetical protein